MAFAIYFILLFVASIGCGSSTRLTECYHSCISKITDDNQLCNKTCLQLLQSSSANNTGNISLPTPDPPLLLSSSYFTFTLQWSSFNETKYNASSMVYVLEVTRHENVSDPVIMLPHIEKYHTTTYTTFTIPEDFVTKTNFSFRLAVVTPQGTTNFSSPSLLYTTNSSCERSTHYSNASIFYPCPVFNVRLNFTVTPVKYNRPNLSTTLSMDFPHDLHTNLEGGTIDFRVDLSEDQPNPSCLRFGKQNHGDYIEPEAPATGHAYIFTENMFYFGCRYDVEWISFYEDPEKQNFKTVATFDIPQCIHGFCGCGGGSTPLDKSDYIEVQIQGNETAINKTTANVTWSTQAWKETPVYFKLVMLECIHGFCPLPQGIHHREIVDADIHGVKTTYSFLFHNLTKDETHKVIVGAFDKSGCQFSPLEGEEFDAVIPTTAPTVTNPPSTDPSTVPSTIPSTAPSTVPSTTPKSTVAVGLTEAQGSSSATVAAITVPIVLLLVIGLLLLGFLWYYRKLKKPTRLHRGHTGLERLADHLDDRTNYRRNLSDDPSSSYANDFDRFNLVVNLPSKSEGGLELNPAYVEQRIQEAVETGEADEFEFGFHRLELKRVLGKGAFGKVFLAEAYGMGGSDETTLVAVKVLNEKANEDEVEDFKYEINFMKTIGRHENVVTMLGCCTLYPPLCLVVEYVPHGDLLHYLRALRKTFEQQNRKLQGEDIKGFKPDDKSAFSQTPTEGSGSTGMGGYSHRPLVPSASDTALSVASQLNISSQQEETPASSPTKSNAGQRRPLRQCKSEGKQLTISNWIRKYEKFLQASEKAKLNRSQSSASLKALKALSSARRYSEDPRAHYTPRPRTPTEGSNNTETTLVLDSKVAANAQAASPARAVTLDGALDSEELQSFALQIANGMAYLSAKGIVHRDLAARNILVGEDKLLKISDFGLSREGIYVKRSTGKIPLRWLSIEAMRERIYSTSSDVWAFGIVLWEICTLGGFPYPTINDRDLLDFLTEGNRMDKPTNCTDEIYQIMLACWSLECEDRPSFHSLSDQLFDMQKEEHPYVNVDPSQDFTLPPMAGRDAVGNLIGFSDGTFSGETADHEQIEMEEFPNELSPAKVSIQNEIVTSGDEENAGYESSNESDELSVAFERNIGYEIDPPPSPSLTKEPPLDIEDNNFIFMV